jgi:ribosomal protein L35AE/L33A
MHILNFSQKADSMAKKKTTEKTTEEEVKTTEKPSEVKEKLAVVKKKTALESKESKSTTELNGIFVNYRKGRHELHPKFGIIKVEGITTRDKAYTLIGKWVGWTSSAGRVLSGNITRVHGKQGLVIAHFKKAGLPGQAIGSPVKIK